MNEPSKKAQGLIEDYIESAGSDRAIFGYIARLEEALHKIKDAPAQSLWMDSRDDAADQMVDVANDAINDR